MSEDAAMCLVRCVGCDVQSLMNLRTAYEVKVTQKNSLRPKP